MLMRVRVARFDRLRRADGLSMERVQFRLLGMVFQSSSAACPANRAASSCASTEKGPSRGLGNEKKSRAAAL